MQAEEMAIEESKSVGFVAKGTQGELPVIIAENGLYQERKYEGLNYTHNGCDQHHSSPPSPLAYAKKENGSH